MRASVALVGSESLLGREIRDIVATSAAAFDLRLIAADEEKPGTLTRVGDEPSLIEGLGADSLSGARAVLLAGSPESNRKALELADPGAAIVDLTYAAEERPDARLRAPLVESQTESEIDGAQETAVHVIAHPAAIALALFLRRLQMHDPIRRSVIQVFAPASEHGTAGVEELQGQTVSLLSFKSLPHAVFDTQLSFNLLARYGQEAPVGLEDSELRIERHLATLLALPGEGEGAPIPSLRLVQAPVFHGYSFSAWVEFQENPGVEAIESGLAMDSIEVRGGESEPPTNVGNAGQGGIAVGGIAPDRNEPEACWFWLVADNLRLAAENAVAVVRQLL
ncbi:Semialdehyde dehydrogenase, dimerisation region [Candidatus Sulfopaludibacter sp. SbA6]|nr:Semialdehyde dehydrogenase, dimerisation region [Candidatus Sulfopaludibacter sp. SbA6]